MQSVAPVSKFGEIGGRVRWAEAREAGGGRDVAGGNVNMDGGDGDDDDETSRGGGPEEDAVIAMCVNDADEVGAAADHGCVDFAGTSMGDKDDMAASASKSGVVATTTEESSKTCPGPSLRSERKRQRK